MEIFVSYAIANGFGNTNVTVSDYDLSIEDIREIEKMCQKKFGYDLVLLNWKEIKE